MPLAMCSYYSPSGKSKFPRNKSAAGSSPLSAKEEESSTKSKTSATDLSQRSMSCEELGKCVTSDPVKVLLLDCRAFLAFNMKHIKGAFNVNCTAIVKKRLAQGKIQLVDIIPTADGKTAFKSAYWETVVVYDEDTSSLESVTANHSVRLVMTSLLKAGKEAYFLKGGLKSFEDLKPCLLTKHEHCPTDSNISATEQINTLAKTESVNKGIKTEVSCSSDNVPATSILPFMFLGSEIDANDKSFLERNNIRYVLNLTTDLVNKFEDDCKYTYHQVKIEDNCTEDVTLIVDEAVRFIDQASDAGKNVLVHCRAGISRSPTVTIAYLMKRRNLSLRQAYDFVKELRPCIAPNLSFMGQLLELEKSISKLKV